MRVRRTLPAIEAAAFVVLSAVASAHAGRPAVLPESLRSLVAQAVDASAHTWLWLWGEVPAGFEAPSEAADTPFALPSAPASLAEAPIVT